MNSSETKDAEDSQAPEPQKGGAPLAEQLAAAKKEMCIRDRARVIADQRRRKVGTRHE